MPHFQGHSELGWIRKGICRNEIEDRAAINISHRSPVVISHSMKIVPATTWKKRLLGVSAGVLLVLIGWWLVSHGMFYSVDMRYLQPTYTITIASGGVLVIPVSLAPARIITKMAAIRKYQPYRPGHRHASPALTKAPKPK